MQNTLKTKTFTNLPVIVSRGIVAFPGAEINIDVVRNFTIEAITEAKNGDGYALLLMQKDLSQEIPSCDEMAQVGTLVKIKQFYKTKSRNNVTITAISRAKVAEVFYDTSFYKANVSIPKISIINDLNLIDSSMTERLHKVLFEYNQIIPKATDELMKKINATDSIETICDTVADALVISPEERQQLLENFEIDKRLELLIEILKRDIEVIKLEVEISSKVKSNLDKSQRDYYLREQIKVIQSELEDDGFQEEDEETAEYIRKLNLIPFPSEIKDKLTKEIYKLEKMPFSSAEYSLLKSYVDTCLELPYGNLSDEEFDLKSAEKILNEDHYGLLKVKERILEFIAAKKFNRDYKGQILCLIGPPGVGKTSIASSIAKALGKTMARISLGGIHDEADIRGHRKTYIGAMPGRIITALNNAKVMNPLILFDEIDKMGANSYHGDPAAALLEVLDVEQNKSFRDHFIEFNVDLSDCMFVCTANTGSTIPKPLLDRMEIIELPSYTVNEKIHIAKNHLIPKQLKLHGIASENFKITDKSLKNLIELYTKESGVRNLERQIAKICRKSIKFMLESGNYNVNVTDNNLQLYSGKPKYIFEKNSKKDEIGLINGLAWTEVGGELLQIEAVVVKGTGKLELTGSLGDVMKESAKTAVTYIRTIAEKLKIDADFYKNCDIHLHFPDGATPKDGPSAGIAITTCLISALTKTPISHNIAMTGEVTIRGKVLPIGGLKEKTMAALSHKIKTVLIPFENSVDIDEIDKEVRDALEIKTVADMSEVIDFVFGKKLLNNVKPSPKRNIRTNSKSRSPYVNAKEK